MCLKKQKVCFIILITKDCENIRETSDICRGTVTFNANPGVSRLMHEPVDRYELNTILLSQIIVISKHAAFMKNCTFDGQFDYPDIVVLLVFQRLQNVSLTAVVCLQLIVSDDGVLCVVDDGLDVNRVHNLSFGDEASQGHR